MAFFLTPRFAPAYQAQQCNPFGLCAPASRPTYSYRVARPQSRRPQYSSFNHFFSEVDELLTEIDREAQRQVQLEAHLEAQREAHRIRQQRKRSLRAQFGVSQTEQGWQVDGNIRGFEQENISIEITDEHTVKIAGNTHWQAEKAQAETEATLVIEQSTEAAPQENIDGATLNEPEAETATEADTATVAADHSDTESTKSYQAFVEDDYEDLGAEISSLRSASSSATAPAEPKGKEKAVEEPAIAPEAAPEAPAQPEQPQQEERVHGSFERSFKFPERIDGANVTARFEGGALRITVPRATVEPIRKIAIL